MYLFSLECRKYCCKNQSKKNGRRNRESNQFRVDRERIEMNHYEMNGTYRRHESPGLPKESTHSPPRFKIVPADRHDAHDGGAGSSSKIQTREHRQSSRAAKRDEEERQQRAPPASIQANRRTSTSASNRKTTTTSTTVTSITATVPKQRQSSSGRDKPKPYVITRHDSTSDSSSSDSSIDLPPSRPPSPIPEEATSSSGSSPGKNGPVILTRSMLLNNGPATTGSKQTSFQYIPSNLRNRGDGSETTDGGNLSTNRAASSGKTPAFVNPAVSALASATQGIGSKPSNSIELTQRPTTSSSSSQPKQPQPRKGSSRRND